MCVRYLCTCSDTIVNVMSHLDTDQENPVKEHKLSLRKFIFYQMIILIVSLMVGFLIIEGGLRIYDKTNNAKESVFTPDDYGLYKYRNNLDTYLFNAESKQTVHFKTNEYGFIGENYDLNGSHDKPRIAIIGDSFVAAREVDYERSFTFLLQKSLEEKWGSQVEVMNFGVGGQGTVEELLRYQNHVIRFQPDLVVLVFFPNDIENNSHYLNQRDLLLGKSDLWSQITFSHGNFNPRDDWKQKLLESSYTIRKVDHLLKSNAKISSLMRKLGIFGSRQLEDSIATKIDPSHRMYVVPMSDRYYEVIDFTKQIINRFNDNVKEQESEFVLVYMPHAAEADSRIIEEEMNTNEVYSKETFDTNALYTEMVDFASTTELIFVDLMPTLKQEIERTGVSTYFSNVGHLNERGHELVAEEISIQLPIVSLGQN